jgi:outer membrane protein
MRQKLIACLVGVAAYGPVRAEDLMQVYRDALSQDPVFGAQRAQYQATKERKVQARGLLLPNINATAGGTYNNTNITTPISSTSLPPAFRRATSTGQPIPRA